MKKILSIILNVFIIGNILVFIPVNPLSAYSFSKDSGLEKSGSGAGYSAEDIAGTDTLPVKIGKAISAILALLGIIFLILTIYGGYLWMLARGNEQEIEKAKNIIRNALVGLIIVLAAYAITYLIINKIYFQT